MKTLHQMLDAHLASERPGILRKRKPNAAAIAFVQNLKDLTRPNLPVTDVVWECIKSNLEAAERGWGEYEGEMHLRSLITASAALAIADMK